jgi:hypothetical protein
MPAPGPSCVPPGAAAQTRMVSVARIPLDSRKSMRLFKGIICADISQFESHMPSQPVRSPPPLCQDRSKRRGTAAFPRHRLVSVCGKWRRTRHSGALSPRPIFGVSFLMVGALIPRPRGPPSCYRQSRRAYEREPTSILPPANRIELVTKVPYAPGIGRCLGAAWKEDVSSCLHTNVHERGLNCQIRFR